MPIYHRLGEIPRKRHTVFEKPDGGIYYEQLMGNLGFTGCSSLLYHIDRPTRIKTAKHARDQVWEPDPDRTLRPRHLFAHRLPPAGGSPIARTPLLFNSDVALSLARPTENAEFFYRNAMGDEIVFVTEGGGVLESEFGDLPFRQGDYVVIPRGILHRYRLDEGPQIHFVIESTGHVRTPSRYRNPHGQLLEVSPFCERDIRRPEFVPPVDEEGDFRVVVKKESAFTEITLDRHPLNVVGWDGYYYPWALSIHDFEPIVGSLHLPPPIHQTFAGDGFVVCSFVSRLYDFHPEAIPSPYQHANVMSDEVIYYANENFMSRKGIEYGSVTFHPDGLPHGPHPGKTEESIGKRETEELAVMVDTFRPLTVAKAALAAEDPDYTQSWLE